MALDESKEDDKIFDENGISFAINNKLFESVSPIKIDYIESYGGGRYSLSSNLSVTPPSCGATCSC